MPLMGAVREGQVGECVMGGGDQAEKGSWELGARAGVGWGQGSFWREVCGTAEEEEAGA